MTTSSAHGADDLAGFIRAAKDRGLPDDALVPLLQQNGWPARSIYRSLSEYYTQVLGIAPPRRGGRAESARDAFLYSLNFITLGFWITALGQLFYHLIAHAFPDAAVRPYASSLMDE